MYWTASLRTAGDAIQTGRKSWIASPAACNDAKGGAAGMNILRQDEIR
jgi:hypothetical protein